MKLFLFGRIRDCAAALHGAECSTDARTVGELLQWIAKHHPDLSAAVQSPGARFAVDQHFADLNTQISADSEVALMAPLSGG